MLKESSAKKLDCMKQDLSRSASNAKRYVVSRTELPTSSGYVSTECAKFDVTHLISNTFYHKLIPIKLPALSSMFRVHLLRTLFPFAVTVRLPTSSQSAYQIRLKYVGRFHPFYRPRKPLGRVEV
jgi:hypothetical protein